MDYLTWNDDVRAIFPDWYTTSALDRWTGVRASLSVGQDVIGTVIARAEFGVWVDIGTTFPALLLVVNMADAHIKRISFEEYPLKGSIVSGRINALGDRGEIGITQLKPDRMIERTLE